MWCALGATVLIQHSTREDGCGRRRMTSEASVGTEQMLVGGQTVWIRQHGHQVTGGGCTVWQPRDILILRSDHLVRCHHWEVKTLLQGNKPGPLSLLIWMYSVTSAFSWFILTTHWPSCFNVRLSVLVHPTSTHFVSVSLYRHIISCFSISLL